MFERESGFIADTPGFSALDFGHIDKDELKHYFIEMNRFGEECKFRNCNHIKEPKVSCQSDIGKWLLQFRYDHYIHYIMKSQIERSDINEENLPITFISRFFKFRE